MNTLLYALTIGSALILGGWVPAKPTHGHGNITFQDEMVGLTHVHASKENGALILTGTGDDLNKLYSLVVTLRPAPKGNEGVKLAFGGSTVVLTISDSHHENAVSHYYSTDAGIASVRVTDGKVSVSGEGMTESDKDGKPMTHPNALEFAIHE